MSQAPLGPKDLDCPLWQKSMAKVCHKCPLWTQLRGTNPNTGQEVDQWNCALGHLPMLLVENAQQARQTGAATESLRNELVRVSETTLAVTAEAINGRQNLIDISPAKGPR